MMKYRKRILFQQVNDPVTELIQLDVVEKVQNKESWNLVKANLKVINKLTCT